METKFFYIKKDEISRIKALQNYIKKLESISPLTQTQLFVVKDNKLSIYGYGNGSLGSGHIKASFDLDDSKTNDEFYFSYSINDFVKFLEKSKSDTICVSLKDKTELVIKGEDTKSVFSQTVLATIDSEVDEITNAISNYEDSDKFKNSKDIDIYNSKDQIQAAASLLSLLNTNKFIKISNGNIRTVDDCSIIDLATDIEEEASILKTVAGLLDNTNEFKYYEDEDSNSWIYIDIDTYGIKLYFVQEPISYQCPTDEELKDMSPKENFISVEVKSEDLFNAFEEFKDVFSNEAWQYKQIKMTTSVSDKKFKMHFDDMVTSIDTELPFDIIENTESENEFSMMLPFIELNVLEKMLQESDTLTLKYSSNPDSCVVNISCEDNEYLNNVIITKLQV